MTIGSVSFVNCAMPLPMYKLPKNDDKYIWTNHAIEKMRYYRLSESLVKRVVRFPKRIEKAIAPNTIGAMSPYGKSPKGRQQPYGGEIWVMYVEVKQKTANRLETIVKSKAKKAIVYSLLAIGPRKRIISAWRYPGVTKPGDPIPVPEDIEFE